MISGQSSDYANLLNRNGWFTCVRMCCYGVLKGRNAYYVPGIGVTLKLGSPRRTGRGETL